MLVCAIAAVIVLAVWTGSVGVGLTTAAAVAGAVHAGATFERRDGTAHRRPPGFALAVGGVAGTLALFGAVRAAHAWDDLAPDRLGPYAGWVALVDDPQPFDGATRVIVEIDGERFELWATWPRPSTPRRATWRGGDLVEVSGERRRLAPDRARRVASLHVVGAFDPVWLGDVHPGAALDRASNRVRAAIERAGGHLPGDDGALFRGLVVGDDRDQPREMIERFRASGLSHLTAVSGQNVGFVLAAAGPLLRRLRPAPRLAVTIGLIGWFVALTRFEPSIVRAGTMAILAAVAVSRGREHAPVRVLALAVGLLALVDPLLVWSVGFWLSVGATAGVCTVGPWLGRRLARLGALALPLGITLGAQIGVVVPSLLVFGRLPLSSVAANLLAVPVAGAVMLYGLPAGLLAGWVPAIGGIVMLPARVGVRWVDTVAALGAGLEPDPPWNWIGWGALAGGVAFAVVVAGRRNP